MGKFVSSISGCCGSVALFDPHIRAFLHPETFRVQTKKAFKDRSRPVTVFFDSNAPAFASKAKVGEYN